MSSDAQTRRLPRVLRGVAVGVAAAFLCTACGSSAHGPGAGSTHSSSTRSPTSSAVAGTSAPSSTGRAPITLPTQSPAPVIKRKVVRPAGLSQVNENYCLEATVSTVAPDNLRRAMTDYTALDEQVNQIGLAVGELQSTLPGARALRTALLRARYPATFAVVQDMTELIAVESGVITAWRTHVLTPVPSLYLRLVTASKQYLADSQSAFDAKRDFCNSS